MLVKTTLTSPKEITFQVPNHKFIEVGKRLFFNVIRLLSIGVGLYGMVFMFSDDIGSAGFKAKIAASPVFWSFHLIGGGIALITSTFVISNSIRARSISAHQTLGKLYALSIVFAAVGGFALSLNTDSNMISGVALGLLSFFWFITTLMAYLTARKKQFELHRIWVYRSFALTISAVLFRLELGLLMALSQESYFDVYATVSWLSWVPILVLTEWFYVKPTSNSTAA